MRLVPFAAEHLERIELQAAQEYDAVFCTPEYGAPLVNDMAWTAFDGDTVVVCAGIVEAWQGRGVAWALLSRHVSPKCFRRINRWVRQAIDDAHARGLWRVETTVDPNFDNAVRWAAALGFEHEGYMRMFGPDKRDHLLVARIDERNVAPTRKAETKY